MSPNTTSVLPTVSVRSLAPFTAAPISPTIGSVTVLVSLPPMSLIFLPICSSDCRACWPACRPASPTCRMPAAAVFAAAGMLRPIAPAVFCAAFCTWFSSEIALEPSAVICSSRLPTFSAAIVSSSQFAHQLFQRRQVRFCLFVALAVLQVLPPLLGLRKLLDIPVFAAKQKQVARQVERLPEIQPRVLRDFMNSARKFLAGFAIVSAAAGLDGDGVVGFDCSSVAQSA